MRKTSREKLDQGKVHRWLASNTCDEPGDSHVGIPIIAKGTRLPEDRVHLACMPDKRIHRWLSNEEEQWSVWRQEPQSIYEKRGILRL